MFEAIHMIAKIRVDCMGVFLSQRHFDLNPNLSFYSPGGHGGRIMEVPRFSPGIHVLYDPLPFSVGGTREKEQMSPLYLLP